MGMLITTSQASEDDHDMDEALSAGLQCLAKSGTYKRGWVRRHSPGAKESNTEWGGLMDILEQG
jgi:hypothetical protein